jgi:hypothetical protein
METLDNFYCRDLKSFIHDQHGRHKLSCKLSSDEKNKLKLLNENMKLKSAQRIEQLKKRISNDVANNIYTKKYQVSSFVEFYVLFNFVYSLNIPDYTLKWGEDTNGLQMNRLDKIIKSYQNPMRFVNIKKPVKYCYFGNREDYGED